MCLKLTHIALVNTMCSDELERDWKRKFLKMERQFLVEQVTGQRGPPLEVDHFDLKISTWAERSAIYVFTEISDA